MSFMNSYEQQYLTCSRKPFEQLQFGEPEFNTDLIDKLTHQNCLLPSQNSHFNITVDANINL